MASVIPPALFRYGICAVVLLAFSALGQAQTYTWDPGLTNSATGGGTGIWATATANWFNSNTSADDFLPATAVAVFANNGAGVTVDVGGVSAGGLTFTASGYSLSGGTITLTGTTATVTVGSGLSASVGNVLAGSANLVVTGGGALTLGSAVSTYTGTTQVASGTLNVGNIVVASNASGLGNATTAVILGDASNKGTLNYTGNNAAYTRGFTISAGGGEFDVATSGQTVTVSTATSLASGAFTIGGAGNTTISTAAVVPLTGTNALTKTGAGTLTLQTTTVVSITATVAMPINITAGTLTQNVATATNLTNPLGTGTISISPGATLNLNNAGATDTYANVVNVANATGTAILKSSSGIFTFSSAITLANAGSTLALQNSNSTASSAFTFSGGISGPGNVTFTGSGAGGTFVVQTGSLNVTGTVTNQSTNAAGTVSISSVIGANVTGVIQNSVAPMTLTGLNTYTAKTTITTGRLSINTIQPVGSATGSALGKPTAGANSVIDLGPGGTLQYTGSTAGTTDRVINLTAGTNGTYTLDASGSIPFQLTGGVTNANTTGTATLALTGTSGAAAYGLLNGTVVNGSGTNVLALSKTGAGFWYLEGTSSFTGGVAISTGTLVFGNTTGAVPTSGAITVTSGATLGIAVGGANEFNNGTTGANSIGEVLGGTLNGRAFTFTAGANLGIDTTNATGTVTYAGDVGSPTANRGLVKIGAGTLQFTAAQSYTGTTTILGGTLATAVDNGISTAALVMGDISGATGNLNLGANNQAVASLTVNSLSTTANTITVGDGKTLTVNGGITVGPTSPTVANQSSLLTIGGGGALSVSSSGATVLVGANTSGNSLAATLDLTGLASTTISLGTAGTVRVGNPTGTNSVGNQARLLMPTPVVSAGSAVTTITAGVLAVGDGGGLNGGAGQVNSLVLGTGLTTLNVSTVNIGSPTTGGPATTRDFGTVSFAAGNGTLTLQDATSTQVNRVRTAALNIGAGASTVTTGVAPGTGVVNAFDTTGHSADVYVTAVGIGTQNRGAAYTSNLLFDTGTFDATSLAAGTRTADSGNGGGTARNTTVGIIFGGGTVNIGSITQFGDVAGTYTTAGQTVNISPTLSVTGGNVTIGTGSGTAITMARVNIGASSQNITVSALISLTGGITAINGNIVKVGTTGTNSATTTNTATLTLNGGTLNMFGFAIGDGSQTVVFNAQAGTLSNVGTINGTAGLTKTTAGTLTLAGTVGYTGTTTVSAGRLVVSSTGNLNVSSAGLSVAAGATFAYIPTSNGTLTFASNTLTVTSGGVIEMPFGSTIAFTGNPAVSGTTVVLNPTGTFTANTPYTLLSAGGNLNTATYYVANPTNYTFTVSATPTAVTVTPTTSVGQLAVAFWKGGLAGAAGVWAASSGSASNWTTDSGGSAPTGQVPGSSTNVTFSATGAGNQTGMTLGADMAVNSLTFASASAVTLTGAYSLTIGGGGITVSSGASTVGLGTNLVLGTGQTWANNSASLLTVSGNVDNGVNLLTVGGTGTGNVTISGVISGVGGLTKADTNTLTLSGTNTFSGAVTIGAGTVSVATVTNGGVNGPLGSGSGAITLGTASTAGTLTYSGGANGTTDRGFAVAAGGGTATVSTSGVTLTVGPLSGTGVLTKAGAGSTLTLAGATNSVGGITVSAGTVNVNGTASNSVGAVTVASGNAINFNNAAATGTTFAATVAAIGATAGVTFSGAATIGAGGTTTITTGATTAATFNGAFTVGSVSNSANLTIASGSSFVMNASGSNFVFGNRSDTANGLGTLYNDTFNASAARNVSITASTVQIGFALGSTTIPDNTNSTAPQITFTLPTGATSTSSITASTALTVGIGENSGIATDAAVFNLGGGTNTITAPTVSLGGPKSGSTVKFQSGSAGTLTLSAAGGGKTNLTVGVNLAGATGTTPSSTINLTTTGIVSATLGTVTLGSANITSGSAGGAVGTFTLNSTAVNTLVTADAVAFGALTGGSTTAQFTGTFNLTAGTFQFNSGGSGFVAGTIAGGSGVGSRSSTINVTGGLLNMNGTPINAVNNGSGTSTLTLQGGEIRGASTIGNFTNLNFTGGTLRNVGTVSRAVTQNGATTLLDVAANSTIISGAYTLTGGTANIADTKTLTVGSAVVNGTTPTLGIGFGAASPFMSSGQLTSDGTINLTSITAGNKLNIPLTASGQLQDQQLYTLTIINSTSGGVTYNGGGAFDPNAFVVTGTNFTTTSGFTITGDANTVQISFTAAVPEPGTILGLAAAGMGLAGWVRRSRFGVSRPG